MWRRAVLMIGVLAAFATPAAAQPLDLPSGLLPSLLSPVLRAGAGRPVVIETGERDEEMRPRRRAQPDARARQGKAGQAGSSRTGRDVAPAPSRTHRPSGPPNGLADAAARGTVIRDGSGAQSGSRGAMDRSGRTVIRDRFGNQTGSEERDSSGRTIVRDRFGAQVGSRDATDRSGRTVIRDRFGQQRGSEERTSSGRVIVRDRFGSQIGSRDAPDRSGRVVVRDRFGRQIGLEEQRR